MLELGLDVDLSPTTNLAVTYSGQIDSGVGVHALKTNLGVRF